MEDHSPQTFPIAHTRTSATHICTLRAAASDVRLKA